MKRIVLVSALFCAQGLFAAALPATAQPLTPIAEAPSMVMPEMPMPVEPAVEEPAVLAPVAEPTPAEVVAPEVVPAVEVETIATQKAEPTQTVVPAPKPAVKPVAPKPAATGFRPASRIAVVTMEKLMTSNQLFQAEMKELQSEYRNRGMAIQERVTRIENERRENKRPAADLAKDETSVKIDFQTLNQEMQEREQAVQMKVMQAVQKAVAEIAQKEGIDVVQPRMLFALDACDITEQVLVVMDKAHRAEMAAAKFKKAQEEKQAAVPAPAQAPTALKPAVKPAPKPAVKKAAPKVKAKTPAKKIAPEA